MSKQTPEQIVYQASIGTHVSYFWTSNSTADAPLATAEVPTGCLGAADDGGSTGAIYVWNGSAWKDTGGTVASFYGGST